MKGMRLLIAVTLVCALAMAALGIAMATMPQSSGEQRNQTAFYMQSAEDYLDQGEFSLAIACYDQVIAEEPENLEAIYGLAQANKGLGDNQQAIEIYDSLLKRNPDNAQYQLERINLIIIGGELERAKQELEDILTVSSDEKLEKLYAQMTVSMPRANLESGSYDSYQLLSLSAEQKNAVIYYTLDGSEPTTDSEMYTGELVITAPQTELKAKCINYLGYESPTLELAFAVTVPVEEILVRDYSSYAYAVREKLGRSNRQTVYNYEAAQIRELYIVGDGYYEEPEGAFFYRNGYKPSEYYSMTTYRGDGDLSKLSHTPFLKTLAVCWQNNISLKPIAQLEHLENLSLLSNDIRDITPLAKLTGLKKLSLGWNRISDVTALSGMTELTSLGLWNNRIADISALAGLTNLRYLDVSNNQYLSSLEPAAGMTKLEELWANGNQITQLSGLDPEGSLKVLMLSGNPLEDYAQWRQAHPNLVRTDVVR